jgi:hypothetical protein
VGTVGYLRVLSKLSPVPGLKVEISFSVPPGDAVTDAKVEEIKAALRELGLSDTVERPQ